MRSVPVALSSFEGQRKWVAAGLGLVAAFLLCTVRVACRENLSTVVGGVIPGIEAVKLGLDLGGQSIEELLREIRDQLGVWPLFVPITIVIVKTIRLPKLGTCRSTLFRLGWVLTSSQETHIEEAHAPSSVQPNKSKYSTVAWAERRPLMGLTLYLATSAKETWLGRCEFHIGYLGFRTGVARDGTTPTYGNSVIYQITIHAKSSQLPGEVVTAYPANEPLP